MIKENSGFIRACASFALEFWGVSYEACWHSQKAELCLKTDASAALLSYDKGITFKMKKATGYVALRRK